MSKSQNRGIKNTKRQGNMIPQKVNNHATKDLIESKGNVISFKFRGIIIRMINEMKQHMQKKSMKSKII
jgi:hypothetical protein